MRFDTHRISASLVRELQQGRPRVEVVNDGGDLIRVSLESNETVLIYLIESPISLHEIASIVSANTLVGAYSLFIIWSTLLPVHAMRYRPDDWMAALLALHGGKIYAYDAYFGADLYVFPVYFDGVDGTVRYGGAIDATQLVGEMIHTDYPPIAGAWRVANFEAEGTQPHQPVGDRANPALRVYYQRLGIAETTERDLIKQAYRRLARKVHPDLTADPRATERMQQINEAYQRILADLDERGSE